METNFLVGTVEHMRAAAAARSLLSLREATMLAEVSEKRVRKDIETGVLSAPFVTRIKTTHVRTHWSFVFTLAAIYGNGSLNGKLRKRALEEVLNSRLLADQRFFIDSPCVNVAGSWTCNYDRVVGLFSKHTVALDRFVILDFTSVVREVSPRLDAYVRGLLRTEEKDDVLGGEAVFRGTRLPVLHVGKAYDRGETLSNLLEDYPYLTESDVEFAKTYYHAHPPVGRPPAVVEDEGAACTIDA